GATLLRRMTSLTAPEDTLAGGRIGRSQQRQNRFDLLFNGCVLISAFRHGDRVARRFRCGGREYGLGNQAYGEHDENSAQESADDFVPFKRVHAPGGSLFRL